MRALPSHWQPFSVAQSTVTANIHQALDIHIDSAPEITFNFILLVNDSPDLADFSLRQILDAGILGNFRRLQYF